MEAIKNRTSGIRCTRYEDEEWKAFPSLIEDGKYSRDCSIPNPVRIPQFWERSVSTTLYIPFEFFGGTERLSDNTATKASRIPWNRFESVEIEVVVTRLYEGTSRLQS